MRISNRYPVKYGTTIIVVIMITTCGYFMDLGFLTNNRLYDHIFRVKHAEHDDRIGDTKQMVTTTDLQGIDVTSPEITIVTMYLDIGKFQKGTTDTQFTPDTYKNWMKTWAWLTNRVIGFFDSNETLTIFREVRSSQPKDRTVAIKINQTDLSAFNNIETIRQIYSSPSYPKHPPNTVLAEYSCAMNAKYDALQMAITRGLVVADYVAWMDIGYFRNLLHSDFHRNDDSFTLEVPVNFNSSFVSMSEINPRDMMFSYSPWDYINSNLVWVSGGFLLGTKEAVWTFSESYKEMVTHLLEQNMSSTDQQIIGAMYSTAFIQKQKVGIQPYMCIDGQFGLYSSELQYFCLGFICKASAENRRNNHMIAASTLQEKT